MERPLESERLDREENASAYITGAIPARMRRESVRDVLTASRACPQAPPEAGAWMDDDATWIHADVHDQML